MKNILLTTWLAASFFISTPKIQAIATNYETELWEAITQPEDTIDTSTQRVDGEKENGKIYFPSLKLVLEVSEQKIDPDNLEADLTQAQFDQIIDIIWIEQAVDLFGRGTTFLAKNEETWNIEARTFRKLDGIHEGVVRGEDGEYKTNYTAYNPPLSQTHTWPINGNTLDSKTIESHKMRQIVCKPL